MGPYRVTAPLSLLFKGCPIVWLWRKINETYKLRKRPKSKKFVYLHLSNLLFQNEYVSNVLKMRNDDCR